MDTSKFVKEYLDKKVSEITVIGQTLKVIS